MVRKANYVLVTFPSVGPLILTRSFQSYCLSLYGSCLWSLSSPTLHSIEVAFNKILRKIWNLPRHSHTRILHSVANLSSLFNIVSLRSHRLLLSALNSSSLLVKQIFSDSSSLCCSFCGYNFMFGSRHFKTYFEQDRLCADVIRSFRCSHNSIPGLWRYDNDNFMGLNLFVLIICNYLTLVYYIYCIGVFYII